MERSLVVLLVIGMLTIGATAYGHHSFAATYHEDRTVQIEGKLLQLMFRHPHSFLSVEAPDEKGVMQRWGIEWVGAGQLGSQGVTRETLKAGDLITITGHPGRNPADHRIRMVTLKRKSDGFVWGQRLGEVVE